MFGDYFIYSYNFGVQESQSSVIFQTYSRYGNASYFQFETIGHRDVVLEARLFVRVSGALLFIYLLIQDPYIRRLQVTSRTFIKSMGFSGIKPYIAFTK